MKDDADADGEPAEDGKDAEDGAKKKAPAKKGKKVSSECSSRMIVQLMCST